MGKAKKPSSWVVDSQQNSFSFPLLVCGYLGHFSNTKTYKELYTSSSRVVGGGVGGEEGTSPTRLVVLGFGR